MIIRPMTEADIQDVVDMGAVMHAEGAYINMTYDPHKCADLARAVMADTENQIALVAETEHGEVVGMLSGYVIPFYFGPDLVSHDRIVYIIPSYRGTSAFLRLVRKYVEWARSKKVRQIFMAISTGINTDKTTDLYVRLGFRHVGGVFQLEV